ncbi:hypothetical protein [Alicyclobacillus cycloheptanicus]|uniref:Uncharacterized protein n=1 Tax=Alicyclobacillus cycloheptanicus TaxID=1457 RepID=A0ABT9XJJ9_9BACL|nr:hypothetical protein [Alicyclobacillus cycloheptanicus]MDQ0190219.1 hypothetical protein [Alicyclobacillus cycloheptanicus]
MQTLQGPKAVEVAQLVGAPLFDVQFQREVSVEAALQQIEAKRDVASFALPYWPDSDDEAETLVLREFRKMLSEDLQSVVSIRALFPNSLVEGPIHPFAAELAAGRLVEQGRLVVARRESAATVYQLPRDVRLADGFLEQLRAVACPDCAALNFSGPFHEVCLTNVIDLLQKHDFTFDDLDRVEVAAQTARPEARWLKAASRTTESVQRLAKTALTTSLAKSRKWQDVLKAVATRTTEEWTASDSSTEVARRAATDVQREVDEPVPSTHPDEPRKPITQAELIHYLQSVEIVPSEREAELRRAHAEVLRHMADKEREIQALQKERAYVEKQFEELQRDMDTVLQALQIARRREGKTAHVIDASYE